MSHCVYRVYFWEEEKNIILQILDMCACYSYSGHITQPNLPGCRKTTSSNIARISRHIFVFWQVVNLKTFFKITEHYFLKLFLFKKLPKTILYKNKFKLQLFFKNHKNYCVCQIVRAGAGNIGVEDLTQVTSKLKLNKLPSGKPHWN